VIKYLGSKRALAAAIGRVAEAIEARTAVDLFTGTTRVAQELKRSGVDVTACDIATYSEVLSECFIATDARAVDEDELASILAELASLPGVRGYVTETFCERSRYFRPANGMRIDAIRDRLETHYRDHLLFPVLLTSLMLAADRVDSTTGVQMAYLKRWAPRALNDLELRVPELIDGPGSARRGDSTQLVRELPRTDLMYLDPPYNQHRYFTNYHIWETLVRWDAPEHYGIACKRMDCRDDSNKSVFNRKREMPDAFRRLLQDADAETVVVSYNDESWITPEQMVRALHDSGREEVGVVAFDSKRYVGAQIGIHNPSGVKVGAVSHLRNTEYLFIAGAAERVGAAVAAASQAPVAAGAMSPVSR
jgi:adenine-specific DNA-methyltransferase